MTNFDVVIVGYGPTGKVLARQLCDFGHRVAIIDRWPEAYPLPRAVGFDHEINRMFHALGVSDKVAKISRPMGHYIWYNADWKVLLDIDETRPCISGGSNSFLFNQPDLERILEADLKGRDGLTTFLGHEALQVTQDDDGVEVRVAPYDASTQTTDETKTQVLKARYVVGCDGANSLVREAMGTKEDDFGFNADWIVVDAKLNPGAKIDVPDAAQWCNPDRPTTIVPSGVETRRWEFMVKPGEDAEALAEESSVWELLSPWMKPEDGTIIRRASYNFRSLLARGWRNKNMLIAGDAAHLMPPFMGQGMCSGLRDSWNLGWKLDRVLSGKSSADLLDSYETERSSQVEIVIRISMELGKIVCESDPMAAKGRDEAFFSGNIPPPPVFPGIGAGVTLPAGATPHDAVTGQLLPHDDLALKGKTARMDDLMGRAMVLITSASMTDLGDDIRTTSDRLGVKIVALGADGYKETDGRLSQYLTDNNVTAILSRPDFYAFGAAANNAEIMILLNAYEKAVI